MSKKTIRLNIGTITLVNAFGVVSGFLFELQVVIFLGLSSGADAFYSAYTIPMLFLAVATNCQVALVAVFSKNVAHKNIRSTFDAANVIITSFFVLFLPFCIFINTQAEFVAYLLAPGSPEEVRTQSAELISIVSILPLLFMISSVLGSLLASNEKFVFSSAQNLIRYSVAAGFLYVGDEFEIVHVAEGLVFGAVAQILVLVFACVALLSYFPRFSFSRDNELVKNAYYSVVAITPSTFVRFIPSITQRVIASFFPAGAIAAVSLAGRIQGPATSVFIGSVISATAPRLGKLCIHDKRQLQVLILATWRRLHLITVPLVVVLVVFNLPLLNILFFWESVGEDSILFILPMCLIYNMGLLFRGHLSFYVSFLLFANMRKKLIYIFLFHTVIEVILQIFTVYFFGILGVAVAFTISLFVLALTSALHLGARFEFSWWKSIASNWDIWIAGISMFSIASFLSNSFYLGLAQWDKSSLILFFVLCTSASFLFYMSVLYLLGFIKSICRT